MTTKHQHWQAVPCGELVPGWEKVPAAAVYFHPATGRVLITGSPNSEAPDGKSHSCDELGCSSVGKRNEPRGSQAMTTPNPIHELVEELFVASRQRIWRESMAAIVHRFLEDSRPSVTRTLVGIAEAAERVADIAPRHEAAHPGEAREMLERLAPAVDDLVAAIDRWREVSHG